MKQMLNQASTSDVVIEMESNCELQNLYDLHINNHSYVELHQRAMTYKRNLLSKQDNDPELIRVNHFLTELSGYHTTLSMNDMKQRIFVLSIIATLFAPATFMAGIFGMNVQLPYITAITLAYNPFFAICIFSLWATTTIGIYVFLGWSKRTILLAIVLTIISFTLMAMFLWVIPPIYDIGYQVGAST